MCNQYNEINLDDWLSNFEFQRIGSHHTCISDNCPDDVGIRILSQLLTGNCDNRRNIHVYKTLTMSKCSGVH